MKIYIPTRGRINRQTLYYSLPPEIQERTTLVVNAEEATAHKREFKRVLVCPFPLVQTIGEKRQYIIDQHKGDDKLLMLDDDLRTFIRREDDPSKFLKATPEDIIRCIQEVETALDTHAHVGISSREGANRNPLPRTYNTRPYGAKAYRVSVLRKHNVKFTRVPVMEDFDVLLQLLRLGYPYVNVNNFVQDQLSSAVGGCSLYRTPARQAEGATALARLHPLYVKTVQKHAHGGGPWAERIDVAVRWKKAFASYKGEPRVL